MSKISIILPIYNTEQYLQRCIDSILAQTFTDFELLLVNDGSTDSSGDICNEYAQKDNRIRVFHKKNGGVSSARNEGLKHITGEWVTFCDSDDWVEENWLEIFITNSQKVQLVVQSLNIIGGDFVTNHSTSFEADIYKGIRILYQSFMPGGLCNKMLKSDIVRQNKIFFNEQLKFREDEEFLLRLYPYVKRMRKLAEAGYNYVVPQYDIKYREEVFYQFVKIYITLKDKFYDGFTEVKEVYVKDLTYSLLDSYQKNEKDRFGKLVLYQRNVGKDVIGNINVSKYMQCILIQNIKLVHFVLSFISVIKRCFNKN